LQWTTRVALLLNIITNFKNPGIIELMFI
jgi:hypothetical protein